MKFDLRELENVIPASSIDHIRWSYGVEDYAIIEVSLSDIMLMLGIQDTLLVLEKYGTKDQQLEFMSSIIVDSFEERLFSREIQNCIWVQRMVKYLKAKKFHELPLQNLENTHQSFNELINVIFDIIYGEPNTYAKIGSRIIYFMHHIMIFVNQGSNDLGTLNEICKGIINLIDNPANIL